MVSTGNSEELCRTVLAWFEQNCTLPSLRPGERILCPIHHTYNRWCRSSCPLALFPLVVVMSSLRELSMKTSILTDPSQVPHQLTQFAKQDMQRKRTQNLPHLV